MNPEFVMLIGLPGSGKSFYCKEMFNLKDYEYVNIDELTLEMYDSFEESDRWQVHELAKVRILGALQHGMNVIFDATNGISEYRNKAPSLLPEGTKKIGVYVDTPRHICAERNRSRASHHAPEEYIMTKEIDVPYMSEGWDELRFIDGLAQYRPQHFYMMIGYPASGKSTYVKYLMERNKNLIYVSTDEITYNTYGTYEKSDRDVVYNMAFSELCKALEAGKSVIFDATNTLQYHRQETIKAFWNDARKIGVYIATPKDICIERNNARTEYKVPEEYMNSIKFEIPYMPEGWDELRTIKGY